MLARPDLSPGSIVRHPVSWKNLETADHLDQNLRSSYCPIGIHSQSRTAHPTRGWKYEMHQSLECSEHSKSQALRRDPCSGPPRHTLANFCPCFCSHPSQVWPQGGRILHRKIPETTSPTDAGDDKARGHSHHRQLSKHASRAARERRKIWNSSSPDDPFELRWHKSGERPSMMDSERSTSSVPKSYAPLNPQSFSEPEAGNARGFMNLLTRRAGRQQRSQSATGHGNRKRQNVPPVGPVQDNCTDKGPSARCERDRIPPQLTSPHSRWRCVTRFPPFNRVTVLSALLRSRTASCHAVQEGCDRRGLLRREWNRLRWWCEVGRYLLRSGKANLDIAGNGSK